MTRQKDKEHVCSSSLHCCNPYLKTTLTQVVLGVNLLLVISLFVAVLWDSASFTQVGVQLRVWPHMISNGLRAMKELNAGLNYNNVSTEEDALRTKLRQDLTILAPEEEQNSNLGLRVGQEVPNEASSDQLGAVCEADLQTSLQDVQQAGTNAVKLGGDSVLQESPEGRRALDASWEHDGHLHQARKVQFTEDGTGWIEFPYVTVNETEDLMVQYNNNGSRPCHNVRTHSAQIVGLPQPSKLEGDKGPIIRLYAGPVYEFVIVSIGDDGRPRCHGGDYYETDLSGPLWKSRPPVLDRHNGTYSVRLQMDPRFASGLYTLKIILLFSNFHGLERHPQNWARLQEMATYKIHFVVPTQALIDHPTKVFMPGESSSAKFHSCSKSPQITVSVPELPLCKLEHFSKKYWSGRWTREHATKECDYDRNGRWQCVYPNQQCQKPWCEGRVGRLESNGWVYSAHCAFKIFEVEEAWQCLNGKWLFFWGDSNHVDTIRNLLNFFLGFNHKFKNIERRMDETYISPINNQSFVRITSMFNGHSNVTMNWEGLFSLHNPEYAQQLRSFFTGEVGPDFMIMNSGLHDGTFWKDVNTFMKDGVEFAANFWDSVWSQMKARRPDILYRTTVSTGGNSRNMSLNPNKMELFNHLILDRFVKMELERFHIIDGFDYTYPWHYDHKTNDGVHYGRPPRKYKWAGGNIGHQYFVDLMLVHMLLNAICAPP